MHAFSLWNFSRGILIGTRKAGRKGGRERLNEEKGGEGEDGAPAWTVVVVVVVGGFFLLVLLVLLVLLLVLLLRGIGSD